MTDGVAAGQKRRGECAGSNPRSTVSNVTRLNRDRRQWPGIERLSVTPFRPRQKSPCRIPAHVPVGFTTAMDSPYRFE
jgi:hypothetical protein